MSELNKSQKILMGILYALTGIALIVIFFSIYNITSLSKPQTLGTIYASTLSRAEEDIYIVEVNIYSNENKNGMPCYEVLWNGYTDYQGNNIKGFGIQSETLYGKKSLYTTDDLGQSTYKSTDMPTELYFDIDGKFYKYQFESYGVEELKRSNNNLLQGLYVLFLNTEIVYYPYTYEDLFHYICPSAETNSAKHENGEFTIPMLDLSKYVKIMYQNEHTQYVDLPKTSTMYEFFKVKVNYSKDGMTDASQSMFHQFRHSPTWNYYNNTDVEKYWNAYSELQLNEKHINYVYNEFESAYYIVLDTKFSQYLKSLSYSEISIVLDTTAVDFDIYGIDLEHFDFKIKSFEIIVDSVEDFEIYNSDKCSLNPTIKAV